MKPRKLEFNMDIWEKGDTEGTFNINTMDNVRIRTALIGLKMEATNEHGLLFCRVSSLKVLREYWTNLPRTKKGAYETLVANGMYNQPTEV
jgi:hypothetical protein